MFVSVIQSQTRLGLTLWLITTNLIYSPQDKTKGRNGGHGGSMTKKIPRLFSEPGRSVPDLFPYLPPLYGAPVVDTLGDTDETILGSGPVTTFYGFTS